MPSSTDFENAAAYLSSNTTLSLSNQQKLELYGLYKCATVSITPNVAKPSIFDIYGKPKWEAWNNAGKTCEGSQEIAEQRYLALARQLGWSPSAQPPSTPKRNADTSANQQSQNDDDDIWDREDDKGKRAGGGGFSVSVSSVTAPPMADGEGVHALAVSGNVESLRDLLSKDASDINSVDEYGYTPLHLAADRGHADIVRLLLDYRANVSAKDEDDYTPLDLATIAGHPHIATILSDTKQPVPS
ncbi:ankyrin repeat-containing domain protein [Pterulicium gracile]|uniref:Ankyrin repeat-containing domain protein n=1 Tax=Pterulicium gracile TaxID=1884261 RepID=A0A5C3QXI8_9AGAR|nr:ankyrin repeat-containing domain protein [Pterula gracilis]